MPVNIEVPETPDPQSSPSKDYETFCGSHVTTATQILCVLYILGACLFCLSSTFPYVPLNIAISIIIISIATCYGIFENRPYFMIPLIILLHISLLIDFGGIFVFFVALCLGDSYSYPRNYEEYFYNDFILPFYFCIFKFAFDAWFLNVSLRCEKFLGEIKSLVSNQSLD